MFTAHQKRGSKFLSWACVRFICCKGSRTEACTSNICILENLPHKSLNIEVEEKIPGPRSPEILFSEAINLIRSPRPKVHSCFSFSDFFQTFFFIFCSHFLDQKTAVVTHFGGNELFQNYELSPLIIDSIISGRLRPFVTQNNSGESNEQRHAILVHTFPNTTSPPQVEENLT